MISKDNIQNDLTQIAVNNNIYGDTVNLIVQELTYALYHSQLDTLNALQEANLSTASLVNSKIRSCMNVMYPVYRGKNARVKLTFTNKVRIAAKKFDVLYTSNNFKIYASESLSRDPSDTPGDPVIGILSKDDLYESEVKISDENKYYVDFKINRDIVSNISEDLQILIGNESNWTEYPVTRDFHYHVNQTFNGTTVNNVIDENLFVLTLPDYGIRVFKKGYFPVNSTVKIRALGYTTVADINRSEFNRISIPGTQLKMITETTVIGQVGYKDALLDYDTHVTEDDDRAALGIIDEVERDDERSLLYNANYYERLQQSMLTKSDVNHLFQEHFIDLVRSSINVYKDGIITIYYIPKSQRVLQESAFNEFKNRYGSYFISGNLECKKAQEVHIRVDLEIYLKQSKDLTSEVTAIFDKYAYKLNSLNAEPPTEEMIGVLNTLLVRAEISKLDAVEYISKFKLTPSHEGIDLAKTLDDGSEVPTYFTYSINIVSKSNYENIS